MTGVRLELHAYGNETGGVPIKVDVFDDSLARVASRWLAARETHVVELPAGLYGVRASVPSGRTFETAAQVMDGETTPCPIPLHEVSPHEVHEWAYLTRSMRAPGKSLLSSDAYSEVGMQLWSRRGHGVWEVVEDPPFQNFIALDDGTTFSIDAPDEGLFALQVSGPRIPSKITAIPSTYRVQVLVRPVSDADDQRHEVDIAVSSDRWRIESLLSMLQSGDFEMAKDLERQYDLAEEMLYTKVRDTAAAAVGGYFLVRTHQLERLHGWAVNLANWFPWMADGPVIHAWQLILEASAERSWSDARTAEVRQRLLDAVERGFPIYTEGLRLLRDGLLLVHRRAKGEDAEIAAALERIGRYHDAADWGSTTTTFAARHPEGTRAEPALAEGEEPRSPRQTYLYPQQ